MKKYFLLLILSAPLLLLAQWTISSGITSGRNDDITFVNDSVGYVAGGNRKSISKTIDGGNSWFDVFVNGSYLRSIEFIDESTGFCGSLDSALFMTTDSGSTWIDISTSITPRPKGICGLSIPDDSTVYGVGIYNQPAFYIKSTDRGQSWTYNDLSGLLSAVVEVQFISSDTGWVSGRANPSTDGGEILYTTDGGVNWVSVYKTNRNLDYVWKIQSPDGQHYFGSVSSSPAAIGTHFLRSNDRGLTWTEQLVDSIWTDIQMIGFIDSLRGWTGGATDLFNTNDGGLTWQKNSIIRFGGYYNRFVKKDDTTAFISGTRIYKFSDTSSILTAIPNVEQEGKVHQLNVFPNPTSKLNFTISIGNRTHAVIQLINQSGEVVEDIYDGVISKGMHEFNLKKDYLRQMMFLIVRTNEGLQYEKVVFR